MQKLNHKIIFYVPSTHKNMYIGDIEFARRVNSIAAYFSRTYGGATLENVKGFWRNDKGTNTIEEITKVISFTDDQTLKKTMAGILAYSKLKKKQYIQESIGIEIDNEFILID